MSFMCLFHTGMSRSRYFTKSLQFKEEASCSDLSEDVVLLHHMCLVVYVRLTS